jgi:RNA polymerase sigma-70 factor (ECF subfamily)
MINLEEIIEGCRRKNGKAQKKLYDEYAASLLGVCIRYTGNKSDAEDILQEGFIKIFLNFNEYSGKGSLFGWMKKIMINTAITLYYRNLKHNKTLDIYEIDPNDINQEDEETPDLEYTAEELLNIINGMPSGYRVVFNLFAIEGYKHKEISEMLGIDESTSKSQYARAKKWIQNKLISYNKIRR